MLAARHPEGADGLGLVHLAVAHEAPDPAGAGVDEVAGVEVAVDVGLVDGGDGPQSHGDRGELPEPGAAGGGGGSSAGRSPDLIAEGVSSSPSAAPRRRPRRKCRATRPLEIKTWSPKPPSALPRKKWPDADLVEGGRAGVGRQVPADALGTVSARVTMPFIPTDVSADATLLVLVAGKPGLGVRRDGVHVRRLDGGGELDLLVTHSRSFMRR